MPSMKYDVGMEVERLYQNRWYPAFITGIVAAEDGDQYANLRYLNSPEQDEEIGVLTSYLRPLSTPSVGSSSSMRDVLYPDSRYFSSCQQRGWMPVCKDPTYLSTMDDIVWRGRGRRRLYRNSTRSKSLDRVDPHQTINLKPLSDMCAQCRRMTIFRCFSCSIVFYCSKMCQRKAWPQHRLICVSSSSRYQPPFTPLFTKDSLERLRQLRQVENTVNVNDSSPPSSSEGDSPLNELLREDKSTLTEPCFTSSAPHTHDEARYAQVYPLFEEPPEQKEVSHSDVEALLFTGASEKDIRKALKLYNNDVNEAANWLLLHENYSEEDSVDLPSLMSDKATVRWGEVPPSSSSAKNPSTYDRRNGFQHNHASQSTLDATFRAINEDSKSQDGVTAASDSHGQHAISDGDSDAVFGLCEMLGVPYILAQQAMVVFKGERRNPISLFHYS